MGNVTLIQFSYSRKSYPLGPLYLASGMDREGIEFDLKLYPLYRKDPLTINKLYPFLSRTKKIIAVGCWSDTLPYIIAALKRLKRDFPEKTVILGGVGPTMAAEDILDKFKFIDFVIRGCGVRPLPKLVKKLTGESGIRYDDIERLVFRRNGRVIANRYEGFYLDIPGMPAYHRVKDIGKYSVFSLITSAGCPYKCTYCDTRPASPGTVIYRGLDEAVKEIKLIKKMKGRERFVINIVDEAFTVNRRRVLRFCESLKAERLDIKWWCYGRVDTVDEELLKVMAQSGCEQIYYGVESGSNRVLKRIRKGFAVQEAVKKALLSKRYIKKVSASFIYMFPFETRDDFKKTLIARKILVSNGVEAPLFPLAPVKGSGIYHKYKRRLRFSLKIPNYNFPGKLPKECRKLVRANPGIFPNFFHYDFKGLKNIIRLYPAR